MIVVGLDLETTGLDIVNDRPIEVGLTLWSTNMGRSLETRNFLIQSDGVKVTDEITEITGVTQKAVDAFGKPADEAFEEIADFVARGEALVAFNGSRLDLPMMHQWAKRVGGIFPEKLLIDPFTDMPKFTDVISPGMRPQELITMCAKEGIYYDAHEAGADVLGMLKLMSKRDFSLVLARAKSDTIIVKAVKDGYDNRDVKRHKFRWYNDNAGTKFWWKKLKRVDVPLLVKDVNNAFGLAEIDFPVELLEPND